MRQGGLVHLFVALYLSLLAVAPVHADAAWRRSRPTRVTTDGCQELRIHRRGTGLFELRLIPTAEGLPSVGFDPMTSGASIFLPPDGDDVTFVVSDTSGMYELTLTVGGSIQWSKHERQLCFASSGQPLTCAQTSEEVRQVQRIAFGDGWKTEIIACSAPPRPTFSWIPIAVFSLLFAGTTMLQLRRCARPGDYLGLALLVAVALYATLARVDPWRLSPMWGLVGTTIVGVLLLIRLLRGSPRQDVLLLALMVSSAAWAMTIPHPLQPAPPRNARARRAVPPLWIDAAYWGPLAPHQTLAFRTLDDDIAGIAASDDEETWLVLGGSVVAGREVEAAETFPLVAERLLTDEGLPIRIVNAGVAGWNIGQIDRFLQDLGDRLPVHGIVMMSVLNNAAFPIRAEPAIPQVHTLLGAYAHNLVRNYLLFITINFFVPKPGNIEAYKEVMSRLLERELGLGRRLLILDETHTNQMQPRRLNHWFYRRDETYRAALREVSGRFDLRVDPVVGALSTVPAADQFVDGLHLTRAGHAAIARELAALLKARR